MAAALRPCKASRIVDLSKAARPRSDVLHQTGFRQDERVKPQLPDVKLEK